jgi:CHAT domain-containing protein/Tfp pilus assembly protein PilF
MQCAAQGITPLAPGQWSEPITIRDGETHRFRPAVSGELRVTVENLSRGTRLTVCNAVCDDPSNHMIRTTTWRGPEHFHSAVFTSAGDINLEIEPDTAVGPAGEYRIRIELFPVTDRMYAGELAMARGADLHASYWWEGADSLDASLQQFRLAAATFDALGEQARLADALFEEASVHFDLSNFDEAYDRLLQAESIWRQQGDRRGTNNAMNLRGLIKLHFADELGVARPGTAVELFEQVSRDRDPDLERYFYAQAANNLGLAHQSRGDHDLALAYFRRALNAWSGSVNLLEISYEDTDFSTLDNGPWLEDALITLMNMSLSYQSRSKFDVAMHRFRIALSLSEQLDTKRLTAEVRTNLGRLYYQLGLLDRSLGELQSALVYFRDVARDEVWLAQVYNNLGLLHYATGDFNRAKNAFDSALENRTAERDPVGRAETLRNIAILMLEARDYEHAIESLDEAFLLLPDSGDLEKAERARLHSLAGQVYLGVDDIEQSLAHHDRAVSLSDGSTGYAAARSHRGWAMHVAGRDERAEIEVQLSIEIAEKIRSVLDEFRGYAYLARIHWDRSEFPEAVRYSLNAIDVSNQVRAQLRSPGLLREFAAVQQSTIDILINAKIQQGLFDEAWQFADQSRARRFRELLRESGISHQPRNPQDLETVRTLKARLASLAEQRTAAIVSGDNETADITAREITPLLLQIEGFQETIDEADENLAALPLLGDIQSELAPGDTLLEYHFSELGSGVWSIRSREIDYLPIANGEEVEALTYRIRQIIRTPQSAMFEQLRRLSELVLVDGAVPPGDSNRIIVVPDGSLQLIPFSMLLSPASGYRQALVDSTQIAYLPSASAMLDLAERGRRAGNGIAIIADPVFDYNDDRLKAVESPDFATTLASLDPELQRGSARGNKAEFSRLYFAGRESEAIQALASDIPVFAATGTEASRDLVMNGSLGDFEILHFATHGVLDMEEPALSGLVMSGVTSDGRPRRRFLRTQDIATLDLKADLVVLSGCDTGVGKLVRGEGLQSLSRAFFFAGAEQVVSSLWSVPDAATAELMGVFYKEMLQNGKSAAQALRFAQLHVMDNDRWEDPYYWAAFVVQGRLPRD